MKLKLPAFVGVPLNSPAVLRSIPPGGVPEITDHEKGGVPLDAVKVKEYGMPTVPLGSGDEEAIVNGVVFGTVKFTTSVGALEIFSRLPMRRAPDVVSL